MARPTPPAPAPAPAAALARALLAFMVAATVAAVLLPARAASENIFEQPKQKGGPTRCHHERLNTTGHCIGLDKCAVARWERRHNMYPQTCRFSSGATLIPEVCCPEVDADNRVMLPGGGGGGGGGAGAEPGAGEQPLSCRQHLQLTKQKLERQRQQKQQPGSIARQKCTEYVNYVCAEEPGVALMVGHSELTDRCHYRVELITGGKEVDPKEFPHMALLGYSSGGETAYSCGGALISPDFVLTAAHCLYQQVGFQPQKVSVRWVLLGSVNRSVSLDEESGAQLLEVEDVMVHPDYRNSSRYHDIALLRLKEPAVISDHVRPACLHTALDSDPTGLTAIATGWGATGNNGGDEESETLLKVNLPVIRTELCHQIFSDKNTLKRGIVASQLCAGGLVDKDSCTGDSGGPLQIPTNEDPYCQYRVVGVVSFGPVCGIGLPAVYTRVSAYVPWIESIVWADTADDD